MTAIINKRFKKSTRLNLNFMSAVNNENKTNGSRYSKFIFVMTN
jgi:hypothetical protein